jgi:hypothetical protein
MVITIMPAIDSKPEQVSARPAGSRILASTSNAIGGRPRHAVNRAPEACGQAMPREPDPRHEYDHPDCACVCGGWARSLRDSKHQSGPDLRRQRHGQFGIRGGSSRKKQTTLLTARKISLASTDTSILEPIRTEFTTSTTIMAAPRTKIVNGCLTLQKTHARRG